MSTRIDSYVGSNGQILTSGSVAGQAALVGNGRAHVVAQSKQFDLTGSNAGNDSIFIISSGSAAAIGVAASTGSWDTKVTFYDGTIVTGNHLPVGETIKASVSKIVAGANDTVTVIWNN